MEDSKQFVKMYLQIMKKRFSESAMFVFRECIVLKELFCWTMY